LSNFLAPLFFFGHDFCLNLFDSKNAFRFYEEVLVCGERAPTIDSLNIDSSFLHNMRLFTASGLSFIFFEKTLTRISASRGRRVQALIFCGASTLTCVWGFSPAVLRAWLLFLVRRAIREDRLNWPAPLISFFVGVACLLLRPDWVDARAFYICWLAGLIMSAASWGLWPRLVASYVLLAPIVSTFETSSFFQSIMLALAKPLVIMIMWPLSALVAVWPASHAGVDYAWQAILNLLHHFDRNLNPAASDTFDSHCSCLVFFYVLALHAVFFVKDRFDRLNIFWSPERYAFIDKATE
jgi:hypothetical protein